MAGEATGIVGYVTAAVALAGAGVEFISYLKSVAWKKAELAAGYIRELSRTKNWFLRAALWTGMVESSWCPHLCYRCCPKSQRRSFHTNGTSSTQQWNRG